MTKFGGFSGDQLRQYIERIERLEQEKQDVADNIKDAFAEAKSNGFDVKIMRQIIRLRKLEASDRDEQEAVLDLYKHALGMLPDFEAMNSAATLDEPSVNAPIETGFSADDSQESDASAESADAGIEEVA